MRDNESHNNINRVVVIGGGTAGWLAAGVLAAKLSAENSVTLIESPVIPTIGVGEGSWPSLKDTLLDIGISELEFLSVCHGSYKQGSSFANWRKGEHKYYHPFTEPAGYREIDIHAWWQAIAPTEAYENAFSIQAAMCEAGKAPKQATTPDYAHVLNYGYHFDATALATLLKKHCINKLNVTHVVGHIASVNSHQNGYIKSVVGDNGHVTEGDLFIDCSGSNGLLIDKHFKVPWVSVEHIMLNNRAVALQVPYSDNDSAIESTTLATAHPCGWTWDIALQHRRGVGLVYSSQLASDEQAYKTLINYVSRRYPKALAEALTPRTLAFEPGHREHFWVKNCLSLGMSSGFVEPLEASAIAMVELGLRMLCEGFPQTQEHMTIVSKRYNQRFRYRWRRVIDFLKLHYVLSDRDEPYWRAQRDMATVPESLRELLTLWKYQSPSRLDLIENEEVFPSASYQYVLYGMGYRTLPNSLRLSEEDRQKACNIREKLQQTKPSYFQALPSNNALLKSLAERYATSDLVDSQCPDGQTDKASSANDASKDNGNINNNVESYRDGTPNKKDTQYDRIGFR